MIRRLLFVVCGLGCFDATQPIVPAADVDVRLLDPDALFDSFAVALNEEGEVAGYWSGSAGRRAFRWSSDTVITPATLGGGVSFALDIAPNGAIVGASAVGDTRHHAFLWDGGVPVDLGTLGGDSSLARAINESGVIVGWAHDATGGPRAVRWVNGQIERLIPGSQRGDATHVNESGMIAGWVEGSLGGREAFVWDGGTVHMIPSLGGRETVVGGINEQGAVVGWSTTSASGNCSRLFDCRAFIWQGGVVTDLGTLGGNGSRADAISGDGTVVGSARTGDDTRHAFRWTPAEGMVDLGSFGESSQAVSINDRGIIVGRADIAGVGHAVVWRNDTPLLLRTLGVPGSRAWGVNDRNEIVGVTGMNRRVRGVIWALR